MRMHPKIQALVTAALVVGLLGGQRQAAAGTWEPEVFAKEDTLKLRTVCPDEGEYWFPVWLVVLEGQVYVRLGSKAAGRIECNQHNPVLGVEIGGQRFEKTQAVPAPEMAEAVAKAMGEKYTSDFFIRWFPHPLTLRLTQQP